MVIKLPRKYIEKPSQKPKVGSESASDHQNSSLPGTRELLLEVFYRFKKRLSDKLNYFQKRLSSKLNKVKHLNKGQSFLLTIGLVLVFLVLNLFRLILFAQTPIIYLEEPASGAIVRNETLYVKGKVTPARAYVGVNDKKPAMNGDGGFTAIIDVPRGESVIKVTATYWFKKSEVLVLVNRKSSTEETLIKGEESSKFDSFLEAERQSHLRITTSQLVVDGRNTKVVGELTNYSENDIADIEVTATFFNAHGAVVDQKSTFAYGFDDFLRPGEKAMFETDRTGSDFVVYELSLAWDE